MCESCSVKINLFNRKQCAVCHSYFCATCVGRAQATYRCKRCQVFTLSLIRRRDLEKLASNDLRQYFTGTGTLPPPRSTKEELVRLILQHQAHSLSEKSRRAFEELNSSRSQSPTDEFVHIDAGTRPGGVSETGLTGLSTGLSSGGQSLSSRTGAQIRAEVKRQGQLRKLIGLEDVQDESQIRELSVRELKTILQRNCVNYKGCVEKQELLERVVRLWHSRQEQRVMEAKIEEMEDVVAESEFHCKVCMDAPVDCVLLECGHMLTCVKCGRQLAECPVCRNYISRVVHAFRV